MRVLVVPLPWIECVHAGSPPTHHVTRIEQNAFHYIFGAQLQVRRIIDRPSCKMHRRVILYCMRANFEKLWKPRVESDTQKGPINLQSALSSNPHNTCPITRFPRNFRVRLCQRLRQRCRHTRRYTRVPESLHPFRRQNIYRPCRYRLSCGSFAH